MTKINELLNTLNKRYPFIDAEKWDNVGLLVGSEDNPINQVYLSLDINSSLLDSIPGGSTLITHHPLIFKPLKNITYSSYHGKILKQLIQKDINYIVLHTNYDKHFLNKYFIKDILGYDLSIGDDFLDYFNTDKISILDFKKELELKMLSEKEFNFVDSGKDIQKVAVCTGSGSSYLNAAIAAGADLLITGDITYHVAMEAKELGLSLIDITHYHSEKWFGDDLSKDFGWIKLDSENPFGKEL